MTQNQLCRWAEADVIIFIGCGERGNEITQPRREASLFTGVTIGEYYRSGDGWGWSTLKE